MFILDQFQNFVDKKLDAVLLIHFEGFSFLLLLLFFFFFSFTNLKFTHAWGTLQKQCWIIFVTNHIKQHLIKSERAWNVHWRASNARQTRSERIQRACSARGTYLGRISHTPETRRAFRKFLSMFILFFFFWPKHASETRKTFSDVQRRAPDVHQAYPTRL